MGFNKTKVLYVVSTLRRSGPTTQLLGIVKNLNKDLFEAKVLTLSPEPSNSMTKEFSKENIEIDSLGLGRVQFSITGKSALEDYIARYKPNIIHTQGVRADTTLAGLNLEAPHCMTIRNYVYDDYLAKFGKVIGTLAAKKSLKAMKKREYVVCCSESLKEMYKKVLPQKLYTIQNGVDVNKFNPASDITEKMKIRSSLGLPNDKMIFLVVGSLIKRKDPITVIEAFKKAKTDESALLLFLGEGELMEQCKSTSNRNIVLKGNVDYVNSYLKASDVFISASKSEGLPNSVLESGSTGMNMILSDIPQHREIFDGNDELANFFEVGNTLTLSKKINKSMNEFNLDINNDISNYISDNFSNESMSKKYQEMYLMMNKSTK